MDSISGEKSTEEQNNIFALPDALLVRIFSELSWKDVLNARLVSRSFCNFIHENYHQLNRKEVYGAQVSYEKEDERHPFHLDLGFYDEEDEYLPEFPSPSYNKKIKFQTEGELSRFIKMFDIRSLAYFDVLVDDDDLDIFEIVSRFFQNGTKIHYFVACKLAEKHFNSFRTFINKLSSIKEPSIDHICSPSTEPKDILSDLSLASFDTIESFKIFECHETRILSIDMVTDLFRKNPNLTHLDIGSMNIEFLKSVFKEFFTMEQPRNMRCRSGYNPITLRLRYGGEFEHFIDTLRQNLSELENVWEQRGNPAPSRHAMFVSATDCKYCLQNKHQISRYAILWKVGLNCQEWDYRFIAHDPY
uniref:F-box domain-containing protein n=1 Tax=Strongyloides papillosus TaxID=174720 RepID=A0A0N5BT50_STREA